MKLFDCSERHQGNFLAPAEDASNGGAVIVTKHADAKVSLAGISIVQDKMEYSQCIFIINGNVQSSVGI